MSEYIKVACRWEPLLPNQKNVNNILTINKDLKEINIKNLINNNTKKYNFNYLFDENSSQKDLHDECIYDLIEDVLEGYNGTIFSYGEKEKKFGKTYTMIGNKKKDEKGIIPRSLNQIFQKIKEKVHIEFSINCSMYEIYNEQIYDLLSNYDYYDQKILNTKEKINIDEIFKYSNLYVKNKLNVKENSKKKKKFNIDNIKIIKVKNEKEIKNILKIGLKNLYVKHVIVSSYGCFSNIIFTININSTNILNNGTKQIKKSRLTFVDIQKSCMNDKLLVGTGTNFYSSVLNLKRVINSNNKKHIPYRNSKLTKLLKDSLGGNSKTLFIFNINSSEKCYEESLDSLNFANNVMIAKNLPIINVKIKYNKLKIHKEKKIENSEEKIINKTEKILENKY